MKMANYSVGNVIPFVCHIEEVMPDAPNYIKTDILIHMMIAYQQYVDAKSKREFRKNATRDSIEEWLLDTKTSDYFLQQEYIYDMSVWEIARELYQSQQQQQELARIQKPYENTDIKMSQLMFWQTPKTVAYAADVEANFLDWLTEHDEYENIARKLLALDNFETVSDDTWYCRVIMLFGRKYYPESADEFTERDKLELLAKWLYDCPQMHRVAYNIYLQICPNRNFKHDEFVEYYGSDESAECKYYDPEIQNLSFMIHEMQKVLSDMPSGSENEISDEESEISEDEFEILNTDLKSDDET